jgi:hypothetical protein
MLRNLLPGIVAIFALWAGVAGARGDMVGDPAQGYSFDLPRGWRRIPQADIDRAAAYALGPGSRAKFVGGFEPASHTHGFEYPYILIQVVPHRGGVTISKVSESDLRSLVNSITGLSTADIKQTLSPSAASVIDSVGDRSASYFCAPPGFQMDFTVLAMNRKSHDHGVGLIGRDRAVIMHLYSTEADYRSETDLINTIGKSLKLDASQAVAFQPSFFDGSPEKAMIVGGGIVGAILLLVIVPLLKAAFRPVPRQSTRTGSPIPSTAY